MNILRIHVSLFSPTLHCEWVLIKDGCKTLVGTGLLSELPQHAEHIQVILPASQVLITRAQVPLAARRSSGSLLAYAIEDETLSEPDSNQVSWLGKTSDNTSADINGNTNDLLAVIDKAALTRWQQALESAGMHDYEILCETFMLPYTPGEWSVAWNGSDGFVRTDKFDGAAMDCGDHDMAPLSLHMLLEEAKAQNREPTSIALYIITSLTNINPELADSAFHDVEKTNFKKWSQELGVNVQYAGLWDWRNATSDPLICVTQKSKSWRLLNGLIPRLQPALWVLGAALIIHAATLAVDEFSLKQEQQFLQQQMETRFRDTFPEAVSVSDPVLQMRRKLTEARHAKDLADNSNFLVMIEPIGLALNKLPTSTVHLISYENGRVMLELANVSEEQVRTIIVDLQQSGISVERAALPTGNTTSVLTLNLRPS